MPPRYAYWTILIDNGPTAFRARDQEELLPTLQQLRRTNPNVEMKWFARGRLWDTPEQAEWARKNPPQRSEEKRSRDWRPGGEHRDPRERFRKKKTGPKNTRDGTRHEGRGPARPAFRPSPGRMAPEKPASPAPQKATFQKAVSQRPAFQKRPFQKATFQKPWGAKPRPPHAFRSAPARRPNDKPRKPPEDE